ncbi:MauE/DoxX family redox-associated membrane protein [Sphingobium sp. CECT 9361]|uniref:MauE/DoxX family redox-associated membrane protein n=1 Tax=Sphingobium sp. CECT 9361 TaxID=2845384 RepID=UPI001E5C1F52|nr:MauE/DoxX family redox-associated membrane protein [Sphingobium sp. CECT 9361]CAH0357233.1 hypothetical protein SPH9361_04882 [Sphingobium sp. CECT 9361]
MAPVEGALALFLCITLVGAAAHKLAGLDRAASAVAGLLGFDASARSLAIAAACVELAIGLAALIPTARTGALIGAAILWGGYALLLDRVARSGRAGFDCGCSLSRRSSDSGDQRLLAAALAALALAVALSPAHAAPGFMSMIAALGLFAIYIAIGELLSIRKITESPS